jgi:uroporphyrinogen-III synthase
LVQQFTAQGATVVEVPAYQSQCPTTLDPQVLAALQTQRIDIITFASSKTVEYFWQLLHQSSHANLDWSQILKPIQLASIGPQTSKTCEALLGRVDIEAQEYTLEGLIQSIVQRTQ